MCSFREAIFIDADSFFFVDPATLFQYKGYRDTGALFFKDRNLFPESKRSWIKSVLPSPISANVRQNRMWTGESGHMQDSGVIVVDKWRHFIPLLLTTRLNGPERDGNKGEGKKGVYDMMYGDKETFWLSWEMSGSSDYSFHDGVAGTMGKLTKTEPDATEEEVEESETPASNTSSVHELSMVCSQQLAHFDRAGRPLWFNGGISLSKDRLNERPDFDVYLREPEEVGRRRRTDPWKMHSGNVVCLRAEEVGDFTSQERSTLEMILRVAKETFGKFEGG